ncbi:putative glycerol kinase [Papilio xuthus]|uniref:Putative glycerol kinase n=1 Tax=Papilio xuthus TaxID=66420 RepID=A0A0N1ICW8_PAPXU|nr:putative glycerol kinase [Papilio xuthus]
MSGKFIRKLAVVRDSDRTKSICLLRTVEEVIGGVIDDGTRQSDLWYIFEAERSEELTAYQIDKTEVQPQEGWYEQDPMEILNHIKTCADNAIGQLTELGKFMSPVK